MGGNATTNTTTTWTLYIAGRVFFSPRPYHEHGRLNICVYIANELILLLLLLLEPALAFSNDVETGGVWVGEGALLTDLYWKYSKMWWFYSCLRALFKHVSAINFIYVFGFGTGGNCKCTVPMMRAIINRRFISYYVCYVCNVEHFLRSPSSGVSSICLIFFLLVIPGYESSIRLHLMAQHRWL